MKGIAFRVDMSDINKTIGAMFAISKIGSRTRYITDLIHEAYEHQEDEFNREVTAFAMASGGLKHMFEWGTLGINNGRSSLRPSPFEDRARLWSNDFIPRQGLSTISFTYRPSVGLVPLPTTKDTRIPQSVLSKLKRHVFWNKAMVIEEGIPVTVRPKPGTKALFVPLKYLGLPGYKMIPRATNPNVSQHDKGTFTMYWLNYWENQGEAGMQRRVENNINLDLQAELKRLQGVTGRWALEPAGKGNDSLIQRTERTVTRNLERAAARRLSGNID